MDNNTFFFLKQVLSSLFLIILAAMELFQFKIVVEIVRFDKCNVIVIFNLKFWLKYLCQVNVLSIPLNSFLYF